MKDRPSITSLQASEEAKELWRQLQDVMRNEVAWQIIDETFRQRLDIVGKKLRCAVCRRDGPEPFALRQYIEPTSGEDLSEIYVTAVMCDHCAVVHWAWALPREKL